MKVGHFLIPLAIIFILTCVFVLADQRKEDWELLNKHNQFIEKAQKIYFYNASRINIAANGIVTSEDGKIVVKRTADELGVVAIQYVHNGSLIAIDEWFNDRRKGRRMYYRSNGQVFAKAKFEGRKLTIITFVGAAGDIIGTHKQLFPSIPFVIYY